MAQHGLSPVPPRPQAQTYIDPDVPAYKVIEKRGFVDDHDNLWPKGSMLYWEGPPSLALDPLNDIAEVAMMEHLEELDALAQNVAKVKGNGHASIVNAFEAKRRAQELERRRSREIDGEDQMPILRARKYEKSMARSVEAGPARPVPMMGHSGRSQVAKQQAKPTAGLRKDAPVAGDKDGNG